MSDYKNITLANKNDYNPSNYDPNLTLFASGWKPMENFPQLLESIAPAYKVPHRFDYIYSEDDFCTTDSNDIRAAGAQFAQVNFKGQVIQAKTQNKGLKVRIDKDDIVDAYFKERYVQVLMKRLYLNEIMRVVKTLDVCANKLTLSEAAEEADECVWNGAQGVNPDSDIRQNLILKAAELTGIYPNRILFGDDAWFNRSESYELQDNPGGYNASSLTTERLSQKLLVDEVKVFKSRHKADDDDSAISIIGNQIFAFYVNNDSMKDEPSNIKRFVTPLEDNNNFRVYVEDKPKYLDISVEHYSSVVITSARGIRKIIVRKAERQEQ